MTQTIEDVLEATLDWPDDARAKLAEELLRTLDQRERERIEGLWYAEAQRRFDARDRGEVGSTPADEVFAALLKGRP